MLQKVSIQNFKSLKDVTLELQKVNLLIGPNNSGKSNFLKALEKFTELSSIIDTESSINNQNIITEKDFWEKSYNDYKISFSLSLKKSEDEPYTCYLAIEKDKIFPVIRDEGNPDINISKQSFLIGNDKIVNKAELFRISYIFRLWFENVIIYKPDPNKLQQPFAILPNQSLVNSDTSNLIAFFDILRDKYPENFKAIENDLNKCIPELTGLRFENVEIQKDDNLYKIYGDKTFKRLGLFDSNKKITYWADELSEGTLYFLALLCIVHQPNPPKLLLLEEPEKGIHPRRIREVMDFIFQLAEDKDIQIIMTTHSERVLDEFEDIPEAVFVFDKDEEGATQVKNLLKDIIEPSDKLMEENDVPKIKFTESLGSHWVTGFIGGVPR